METSAAHARRQLDRRFARLRPLLDEPRPHRGWIRAIRDALGMSGRELASKMGISQATLAGLEASEQEGTIGLAALHRAAEVLECEVVYLLIPRRDLADQVTLQARRKAASHLAEIGHHSRFENQGLDPAAAVDELEAFAERLIDRRGLWTDAE